MILISIHFISTFEKYDKEFSGKKSNTVRDAKYYEKAKKCMHIVIRRGYTNTCFVKTITDVTLWRNICIISWNPNEK